MLNALSSCIPGDQRIVTIEDSAEMILQHPHVARLETRPANSEGIAEYNQRDLVRNSYECDLIESSSEKCAVQRRWICCRP